MIIKQVLIIDPDSPYCNSITKFYLYVYYECYTKYMAWVNDDDQSNYYWDHEFTEGKIYLEISDKVKNFI